MKRYGLLFASLLLLAGCASTSDVDETRRQIAQLNQQSQQRFSQIETKISNDKLLQMVDDVETLKAEVAKLKGDAEVLNYNLQTTQKRQNDLYTDLDQRLSVLEGHPHSDSSTPPAATDDSTPASTTTPSSTTAAPSGAAEVTSKATTPPDPVEKSYNQALSLLRTRDFKNAVPALKTFIDANPNAKQTPDARYWLAISYNAQRQYQEAINTYRRFVELSPSHPQAPEALRNIGNCQRDMGDLPSARNTWKQLIKRYPGTDAASKQTTFLERGFALCPPEGGTPSGPS